MMNPEKLIREFADRAAPDAVPQVQVTHRVLATLHAQAGRFLVRTEPAETPLAALFVASAIAVTVACIVGVHSWYVLHDPALELAESIGSLMQ